MLQNLKSIQVACIIFFILNFIFRIFYAVFPESLTRAQNFPEFNLTNWVYLILTPIFYIGAHLLVSSFNKNRKITSLMSAFVLLFSIYIVLCGMVSSFISTYDPSDSLILYLIALIVVGVMCLFEFRENLLLTILIGVIFTMVLLYCSNDPTEILYNELISVILLTGFFLISRYGYSYKASHYMQLHEIKLKNIEIEKAGAFKNEILGMVAHDLRNPIAAVESLAMMMELDAVDEDTQDNLNMMKASCVKARTIIDDLLEAARNENSSVFNAHKTELNKLLKSIIDVWKIQKEIKNNVVLISTVSPVYALINKEKFPRVIDNLISNAIKFSKDSDRIEVCLSQQKDNIIIEIKDKGLGIPADMLPYIFERFSKAGRTGIKGEQSTGLGLSIVKQIIEKHQGTIEVDSIENVGSTFKIRLPKA